MTSGYVVIIVLVNKYENKREEIDYAPYKT